MRSLTMCVLAERVCRTIHRDGLFPPGARVLVAASGGADSTALVCLLHELGPRLGIEMAALVHVNHGLRGAASDADEQLCCELAGRLSLTLERGTADVAAAARDLGTSVEDAGRQLRYAFFERARQRLGATHVAVGHTRDDQAETVLLNLIRGSGPRGLAAMSAVRGVVVRPLLDCSHVELVRWLGERGVPFREDESNRDPRYLRNRIRHEVLPVLDRLVPSVRAVLTRGAAVARDDADYLDRTAAEAFGRLATVGDGVISVEAAGLVAEPPAIGRRLVLSALGNIAGGRFVGFDQADRVLALAGGRRRGPMACPGGRAEMADGRLVLTRAAAGGRRPRAGDRPVRPAGAAGGHASSAVNSFRAALSIPGEVVACPGVVVSCELRPLMSGGPLPRGGAGLDARAAAIDAGAVSALAVRFRRPGDRFRPLGLSGHKKLQDFFVDRKVPRAERDRTPLVVDANDRIVWVAGHGIAEDFRVGDGTRDVVILTVRGERP